MLFYDDQNFPNMSYGFPAVLVFFFLSFFYQAQWLMALNSAISRIVTNQKSLPNVHSSEDQVTPPLVRHACHKFVKTGIYKDAVYQGSWLSAKVDGMWGSFS